MCKKGYVVRAERRGKSTIVQVVGYGKSCSTEPRQLCDYVSSPIQSKVQAELDIFTLFVLWRDCSQATVRSK